MNYALSLVFILWTCVVFVICTPGGAGVASRGDATEAPRRKYVLPYASNCMPEVPRVSIVGHLLTPPLYFPQVPNPTEGHQVRAN